jgi:hypothetical protein
LEPALRGLSKKVSSQWNMTTNGDYGRAGFAYGEGFSVKKPKRNFYTEGPARLPHGKQDDSRLEQFLLPAILTLSEGKPAYELLQNCVAHLQLAWAGRRVETKAIRLGLIRCAPPNEIARKIDVSRTAVDEQDRVMKKKIGQCAFVVEPIERLPPARGRLLLGHAVTAADDRGKDGNELFNVMAGYVPRAHDDLRREYDAMLQFAWKGRTTRAKAIRLGLIAGVPVREIASKVGLPFAPRKDGRPLRRYTQHVYDQYAMMKKVIPERSIITCAAARWKIYQKRK